MDENGAALKIENPCRDWNKYYVFLLKTLQLLVPVSLVSFLLSYALDLSFFFTYNFHFSTLVFSVFAHALERKYMFLICNGILAFLGKTLILTFNSSSSPPVSDYSPDEHASGTKEVSLMFMEEEEEEYPTLEAAGPGEEDVYMMCSEDDEAEESGRTLLASSANEMKFNTEELNNKFEEFIRKMKEELRIQAQHQLVAV